MSTNPTSTSADTTVPTANDLVRILASTSRRATSHMARFMPPPRPLRRTAAFDGSLRKLRSKLRRLRSSGALRGLGSVLSADGSLRKLRSLPPPRPPCPTLSPWQRADRPFCSLGLHESPIRAPNLRKLRSFFAHHVTQDLGEPRGYP